MQPVFFSAPSDFRAWLAEHHDQETELWVGYYKKGTGKPSITWPESVDEALCFGWIDGLRKSLGEDSYMIRFTPRKAGSIWSSVNIGRVKELTAQGRMQPAGLLAYEKRSEERSEVYAFEQKQDIRLAESDEQLFRANAKAWAFFEAQAGSYRKTAIWGVISAKKEETKRKRLAELIACSEQGQTIPRLTRKPKQT